MNFIKTTLLTTITIAVFTPATQAKSIAERACDYAQKHASFIIFDNILKDEVLAYAGTMPTGPMNSNDFIPADKAFKAALEDHCQFIVVVMDIPYNNLPAQETELRKQLTKNLDHCVRLINQANEFIPVVFCYNLKNADLVSTINATATIPFDTGFGVDLSNSEAEISKAIQALKNRGLKLK